MAKLIVPESRPLIRPEGLDVPSPKLEIAGGTLIKPADGGGLILPGEDGGEIGRLQGRVRGSAAEPDAARSLQRRSETGFVDLNDPRWKV